MSDDLPFYPHQPNSLLKYILEVYEDKWEDYKDYKTEDGSIQVSYLDFDDLDEQYETGIEYLQHLKKISIEYPHIKFVYNCKESLYVRNNYPNCKAFRGSFHCSITLEEFEDDLTEGYMTPCGHKFEWNAFKSLVVKYKQENKNDWKNN